MHSPESGPRGVKTRPPSFFPWRLQWGLSVFQWGSNPHNPPPIFTLCCVIQASDDSSDIFKLTSSSFRQHTHSSAVGITWHCPHRPYAPFAVQQSVGVGSATIPFVFVRIVTIRRLIHGKTSAYSPRLKAIRFRHLNSVL